MLFFSRLCQEIAGCPLLTLGGGTISDLMRPLERGKTLTIWSMGPLLVSPQNFPADMLSTAAYYVGSCNRSCYWRLYGSINRLALDFLVH